MPALPARRQELQDVRVGAAKYRGHGAYDRRPCAIVRPAARRDARLVLQRAASSRAVFHLDGVFADHADRSLRFHAAPTPTHAEVVQLVAKIRRRVLRHLERQALTDSELRSADLFAEASPMLASCYAGSLRGRQTLGRRRGAKLERRGAARLRRGRPT